MKSFAVGVMVCALSSKALAVPAQIVLVTGMVAHPGPVALGALKPVTVKASFSTMHGVQAHSWSGPLLRAVVGAAAPTNAPGTRTRWQHVILAEGSDNYAAAIALGEIDPQGEGKQVIVATSEDGAALPMPRLIVPGDQAFARGVQKLTTLDVK